MSFFSLKNILIIGILLLLLIGIPVGVYLTQQQQVTESQAEQSSVLSFTPTSTEAAPMEVTVGEEFDIEMMVAPGTNKVSVVAFEVNYDPALFAVSETTPIVINDTKFPVTMDEPVFEDGIIRGRVSTANIQSAITAPTKVATITFVALGESETPSAISYGDGFSQVLSTGQADEAAENVLSSSVPAYIIPVAEATPPVVPPTGGPITVIPTSAVTTPTVTTSPGGSTGGVPTNTPPTCTSLSANGALNGVAPFVASFTAIGNDTDGKITKATYNFGDGEIKDSTNAGTASGSATFSEEHTYTTAGTHRASVVFTDNQGGISAQGSCVVTMTITNPDVPVEPTATIEPSGPSETFIGIGIVAGILTFIGGLLFFAL